MVMTCLRTPSLSPPQPAALPKEKKKNKYLGCEVPFEPSSFKDPGPMLKLSDS